LEQIGNIFSKIDLPHRSVDGEADEREGGGETELQQPKDAGRR
jgi:hypothetical protein